MGRLSKAKEVRVKNLLEAKAKQSTSVEDVTLTEDMTQNATDDLHEQGFFILEDDKGSDTDEDESDDEEETGDVLADADISMFSQFFTKPSLLLLKLSRKLHKNGQLANDATLEMHCGPNVTMPRNEGNSPKLDNNLFSLSL
jgi:hypothetical protein